MVSLDHFIPQVLVENHWYGGVWPLSLGSLVQQKAALNQVAIGYENKHGERERVRERASFTSHVPQHGCFHWTHFKNAWPYLTFLGPCN